jgi:hypothetical protein
VGGSYDDLSSWQVVDFIVLDKTYAIPAEIHTLMVTDAGAKAKYECRMDLPGPTTSVGTRTDYSVGPWDYPACATRHLKAWSTRTTQE